MASIHQAKVKSGHLLHKIALVQTQRNRTVPRYLIIGRKLYLKAYLNIVPPVKLMTLVYIMVIENRCAVHTAVCRSKFASCMDSSVVI